MSFSKKVTITFRRSNALDILTLHKAGIDVTKLIKLAVTAYAHGEPINIHCPVPSNIKVARNEFWHTCFRTSDKRLINLLESIEDKNITQFCINVFRSSLSVPVHLLIYIDNENVVKSMQEVQFKNSNKEVFVHGRKIFETYDDSLRTLRAPQILNENKKTVGSSKFEKKESPKSIKTKKEQNNNINIQKKKTKKPDRAEDKENRDMQDEVVQSEIKTIELNSDENNDLFSQFQSLME